MQTIPALLERQAKVHGVRLLARDERASLSFADAPERAARRAGALAAAGVGAGDCVVVLSDNRLEMIELWLGCAWLGAVLVPVNTALKGEQLGHVLRDAAPALVACESALVDRLAALDQPASPRWVFDESFPEPGEALAPRQCSPGDLAVILYTSGTTGPSKGVLCPHGQWYWWGRETSEILGVVEGDILYTCLPLFHTNALNAFMQALMSGATFFAGPRFSASRFWQRLEDSGATVTYLLGAIVQILLAATPPLLQPRHRARVALAPATRAELKLEFEQRFGTRLVDAWGSTETNAVISTMDASAPAGSMGAVTPGFHARVVDGNDEEMPVGTAGELVVRNDHPFAFSLGYHRLPEVTLRAWRNLWFHTGDRVFQDESGWFWFVDRLKDSIRRRGENISSFEVEAALSSHQDVVAAAVVAATDELGDDEVLAFVIRRDGSSLTCSELIEHCESRLAYFAIPRYLEFVDELPLTAGGKIEKYKLRERGVGEGTWDREKAGYVLAR